MAELLLMQYMDNLVRETFDKEEYKKIMTVLGSVENGYCGCEMYYSTYPRLLASKGVIPLRNYVVEYGQPTENGTAAATSQQRDLILNALREVGFSV